MPEEITQRLGFDASKAIQELTRLRNELNTFKSALQSTSGALRQFPTKAMPAIAALRQLTIAANEAKAAMADLATAGIPTQQVEQSAQQASGAMGALATQAESAGQQVQTAVTGSFNVATQSMADAGQAAEQVGDAVQSGAGAAATAAAEGGAALDDFGETSENVANSFTISWKTIGRIVQAQIIVRVISKIVSSLVEAQRSAAEFSKAVAEAFTISGGQLGTMQQLNAATLELANSLGLAADEVAEGVYQTLSNQVVEAGEALNFTNEAAKLAIATNSELRSSVNALSSVMNSYNLESVETNRVADILFKTVELGRLRLSEFGDVLGRVSPLTAALGIRYEEMAAAIAALTQKGVPAHTAITQLTQVTQKLLRPTGKLEELYKRWGVETGPEAIRRFGGLQGVLLKMKDATAGNDKEFADLLGRVRAIVGALNLTSANANALTEALKEMENDVGANKKAFEEMEESVGRKAVKAWERLGNTMIAIGQKLLEVTTPMVNAITYLLQNLDILKAVAIGTVTGLVAMKVAAIGLAGSLTGAASAALALKAAFMTMLPILIATAAVWSVLKFTEFLQDSLNKAEELTAKYKQQDEELTKVHIEQSQRRIQETRKEFEERRKITGEFFSEASRLYRKDFDLIEASSKAVGATLDDALENLLKKRQDAVKTIKDAALGADKAIKSSMEEVDKTHRDISDTAFEREKRYMSERQRLWAEIERAARTAAEAKKAYAEAGANVEAAEAARKLSHLAEERAEEAINHAEEIGNYADLKRAETELDKIRNDRLRGEISFQLERKKFQDDAHQERLSQLEEEGNRLEELIKKVKELSDPLTSEGVLKSLEQRREDAERIAELTPEIKKQLDAAFDFSMFERLGITEATEGLKQGILDAMNKAQIDWSGVLNDLQGMMSTRTFEAPVVLKIQNEYILEEFVKKFGEIDPLGDPGKLGSQMEQVLEETIEKYESLQEKIDQNNQLALDKVEQGLGRLTPEQWYTWLDSFKDSAGKAGAAVADTLSTMSGTMSDYGEQVRNQVPVTEEIRKKLIESGELIKAAIEAQKPLTEAQAATLLETLKLAREFEKTGKLATNMKDQGVTAFKEFQQAAEYLTIAMEALAEQTEIPPGTFEAATKGLDDLRQRTVDAEKAQQTVTDEANKTGSELQNAAQAQQDMTGIAIQVEQGLADETEQARQLRIELEGAKDAQAALAQQTPVDTGAGVPAAPVAPEPQKVSIEELERQAKAARQLADELLIIDQRFNQVVATATKLVDVMSGPNEAAILMSNSLVAANEAALAIGNAFPLITEQVNIANSAVGNLVISLNNATLATNASAQAAANWNSQLQGCAQAGYAAASAMQAAASAAQAAAAACADAAAECSGGAAGAAHGGRYFQGGGRGTDRIPAWLTAGEFVVNARSARKFFPQLQAMNAGQKPIYRDEGGHVTTIGDINVTVQGGETSGQTVREIASGLRRELRRKTVRLF